MKFKKGDEVLITAGKDKGKKGKIERIYASSSTALIPGLNLFKRHLKKKDEKNPGGIIEFPRALSFGKLALICSKCGKPTRAGFKIDKKVSDKGRLSFGQKKRICRKCGGLL
ncbi:MAG: 50S ribosomal protein L24, large subunit ribosomal protein L24 [Candidatus Gottesmanbacteria bacterium GW2011_GWA2_43_14]|uniref:Large ribosomal subunit protein uL24 n=1 Tax=Candidatus Gottesmanbacteria bacterium GW2011_GWA2_43_14 TaxID=1618443 RepID=A0A0G1DEH8_9BACT|nr:MAG: 50S ribosomal protein L24, large subunit ribosomal protein L24 [Candidatus Gottesmanbacteria bacterium GW2011_GWA2_43_14]